MMLRTSNPPSGPAARRPRRLKGGCRSSNSPERLPPVPRPGEYNPSALACQMSRIAPGSGSDRKSTRLNSSHSQISYAVFCLKKTRKTNVKGGSGDADLSIPISGPKVKGTIYAVATKSPGYWTYFKLEVKIYRTADTIDLGP